jgi:sterol desaturase/sphingolipid hydroxylase (fatty acid hydroxylase superfamily)
MRCIAFRCSGLFTERITLNFFTNPRAHPLELLILIGCRVAFASLTVGVTFYLTGSTLQPGTTAALAFYNIAFLGFYTMLTHSHIPISFGGRFNILIAGPVMHQIHHSAEARHMDKNLGGAPGHIFDWLFGTLYLPSKGETFVVGLNEVEYGANNPYRTPRDFFFEPFVYARRLLCRTEATDSETSTQVGEAKGETTV